MSSIHILLSITINRDWTLRQLDVKNAFLYGDLTEAVFMEQPPGYVVQGEKLVCRLKKAIYGLKQSPRTWFEKFSHIASKGDFSDALLIIRSFLNICQQEALLSWQFMSMTSF